MVSLVNPRSEIMEGMSRDFFFTMDTNLMQSVICFFGGLCCLCPLILNSMIDYRDSPLQGTLTSQRNRDSAVAAISLTLPIFMEIATETYSSISIGGRSEKVKVHVKQALLNTRERFVLACGILTTPITAFLSPNTPNLVNIYLCLNKCRVLFVGGAIIISLCRYDPSFWSVKTTYFMIVIVVIANITGAFADNLEVLRSPSIAHDSAFGLFIAAFAILLVCNVRWLYTNIPILLKRPILTLRSKDGGSHIRRDTSPKPKSLFPLLYVTTVTLVSIVLIVTRRVYPENERQNADALFYHNVAFNLYLLFIMYISERMMKYEVVQGLYALIESKKMYVRYISHELRTPLNSAFLGLKLVCDDLLASNNAKDSEHCETLHDVQSACKTAVDILNDLLCFDKLESGLLELHKQDVRVVPFIADCLNTFALQAREGGVRICNITSDTSSPPLPDLDNLSAITSTAAATGLLDSDIVFIDKFKMDQVLRNLISNALKFTPRGGTVTVCASFVPNTTESVVSSPARHPAVDEGRRDGSRSGILEMCQALLRLPVMQRRRGRKSRVYASSSDINGDIESGAHHPLHESYHRKGRSRRDRGNLFTASLEKGSDNINKSMEKENVQDIARNNGLINSAGTSGRVSCRRDSVSTSPCLSGKLRIVVSDTGSGISEANQAQLFKEIVEFNPEVLQAGGGSGLGLWITSNIVQMHSGGSINVFSAGVGKGSTFTVEINMRREDCADHREGVSSSLRKTLSLLLPSPVPAPAPASDFTAIAMKSSRHTNEEMKSPITTLDFTNISQFLEESNALEVVLPYASSQGPSDPPKGAARDEVPTQLCHLLIPDPPLTYRAPESYSLSHTDGSVSPDPSHYGEVYDVLVVDDSSLNRKLLCKLFRNAGYTCEEAEDGLMAIEKVELRMSRNVGLGLKPSFDAVLMDFVMPNMDGPTAAAQIRARGYEGLMIGVTGNILDNDVDYFIRSGVNAVMAKPFDFSVFKEMMSRMTPLRCDSSTARTTLDEGTQRM